MPIIIDKEVPDGIKESLKENLSKYRRKFNIAEYKTIKLSPSNSPNKRFALYEDNHKIASFGFKGAQTFIDLKEDEPEEAEEKRWRYVKRASKIKNKEGQYTYNKKYTPNSLAYWILWQ